MLWTESSFFGDEFKTVNSRFGASRKIPDGYTEARNTHGILRA